MVNESKLSEISPYLQEVAKRLFSNHASVMIGAGFSKNAEVPGNKREFPLWKQLGDLFFEKIHGRLPTENEKAYLNVLKLADEVEAEFDRPTLNNLIRTLIPDEELPPSVLHEKLLQLPWTDIFTTNYDTLLERTAKKLHKYEYQTIVNQDDLIWSTKPRIIKLHGSFPSERPFIITEEDYRTNPQKFAPFINTVQQSLLENTLCLIGFSGDDPNFRNWIGWIKDNLGKNNAPKIYLIGVLPLSIGERRLLEERNIVPVDLSCFSPNHFEALSNFLDHLLSLGKNNSNTWPCVHRINFYDFFDGFQTRIKDAIKSWQKERFDYPGWFIAPQKIRSALWICTEYSFLYNIKKVDKPLDIYILYEFNWRREKCLHPIFTEWLPAYRGTIDKYNPFPKQIKIDNAITPQGNDSIDWPIVSSYWVELLLSLLNYYRIQENGDEWNIIAGRLKIITEFLSEENLARFHYEKCLFKLFDLDIAGVKSELNNWNTNSMLSYWNIKKAGLLAETGMIMEAESILELYLRNLKNYLNMSPVINNYYLLSQEAYALQVLDYVKNFIRINQGNYSLYIDERKEYSKRLNILAEFNCDPWEELSYFETELRYKHSPFKEKEISDDFAIGEPKITRHFGGDDYAIKCCSFLKYIEEIGMPFRLSCITFAQNSANSSIKQVSSYSFAYSLIALIRTGESGFVDSLLDRKMLSNLDQESIDKLTDKLLLILEKLDIEFKKINAFYTANLALSMALVLPKILSRICHKCSYDQKIKILNILLHIYNSKCINLYDCISDLTENLLKSFYEKEKIELLQTFLEFPILRDTERKKYLDPFFCFNIKDIAKHRVAEIDNSKIDYLLGLLSNSDELREKSFTRLVVLWRYKLMSEVQIKEFSKKVWEKTRNDGFPDKLEHYKNVDFLWFPHPQDIDPCRLFKGYLLKTLLPVQSDSQTNSIAITGGHFPIFKNIIGANGSHINYQWTKDEISLLLTRIIDWWDKDKNHLIDDNETPFSFMADQFKSGFINMINIFIFVLAPKIELIDKEIFRPKIEKILNELHEYGMQDYILASKASFLKLFPHFNEIILIDIKKCLNTRNERQSSDALNATVALLKQSAENIEDIISTVIQSIKFRTTINLNKFIDLAADIITKYPQYIQGDSINDIINGLSYLIDETIIQEEDDDKDVHTKLKNRVAGAKLSAILKKYFQLMEDKTPSCIEEWEKICLSTNEFSEIRNAWLNEVYFDDSRI
jgi:hypothetical protein